MLSLSFLSTIQTFSHDYSNRNCLHLGPPHLTHPLAHRTSVTPPEDSLIANMFLFTGGSPVPIESLTKTDLVTTLTHRDTLPTPPCYLISDLSHNGQA